MFDLTKEVSLEERDLKAYRLLRLALYLFSLLAFFYAGFLIMFPTQTFVFSFLNPDASSNTITRPRNNAGTPIRNGKINADDDLYFDASLVGNYSKAKLTFELSKKAEGLGSGDLQAVRSFQSFLYPQGQPLGFKDGTLIKNGQNYYIVSGGELHKFQNLSLADSLGFPEKAFIEASEADLAFNGLGSPIVDNRNFPEASIFKIGDEFYFLRNNNLQKFISSEAHFSHFSTGQALEKEESFLARYNVSENPIGFSDGSLISYADAVYVISEGKAFPIESSITFEAAGYNWDDVIPVSADQISFYKKSKLFTLKDPHPSGTIFVTAEEGKFYIINNGKKNFLPTPNIAYSWLRGNPILVSETGSSVPIFCDELKKEFLALRSYSCEMEIGALKNITGKDYEFKARFKNTTEFDRIRIKFKKTVTADNLRRSISEILSRIRNNYAR